MISVRSSAVAGMFYSSDPRELQADVEDLLQHADVLNERPKAIIAPHAGYIYSGAVAAAGYACLKNRTDQISRILLLGTCHLAGIAARLGRAIRWDPTAEQIVGDAQAQSFVAREPRKGFEIEMS